MEWIAKFCSRTILGCGALDAHNPMPKHYCIMNQGDKIVTKPNIHAENNEG